MISKQPPSYIFPQTFHPHGISREHRAGFVSAMSRQMLSWLRGDRPLAAGETILPNSKVILFPGHRMTSLG